MNTQEARSTENSAYYPAQARYAQRAARKAGAVFTDLDNGNGYLFEISKNGRRFLSGCGSVCSCPVNSATAVSVARDKAHTKTVLARAGLPYVPGRLFFCCEKYKALQPPGHSKADSLLYAQTLGFPVFCKPNKGAEGDFAEMITSAKALEDYIARVSAEYDGFLVEPCLEGTENRVFVKDGKPLFLTHKSPLYLCGTGRDTLAALLYQLNQSFAGRGISLYETAIIVNSGYDPDYVPAQGEKIILKGRKNISAGGHVDKVDTVIPATWADIAVRAVAAVGLRLGAADFMIPLHGDRAGQLLILEVNGNPSLYSLEKNGMDDMIDDIWISMIDEILTDD
jgi:D-alanine-D-alanine ligase-like ATP-grasp enzyme